MPAIIGGFPVAIFALCLVRILNGKTFVLCFALGIVAWLGIVLVQHGRWTKHLGFVVAGLLVAISAAGAFVAAAVGLASL